MKTKTRILLAEDDPTLGFIIKDNLEVNGYDVTLCTDGEDAYKMYLEGHFELALLDVMLPKKDGFAIAREIRRKDDHIPLLFLTARIQKDDRIEGFKTGADDYITKPFSIEELLLRIEVFLKRSRNVANPSKMISIGNYSFDYENLQLGKGETQINITRKEAEILLLFCQSGGNILKREEILMKVWGDDDYFMGRSLDVFLSKLRKRFKDDPGIEIVNLHGVGFRMVVAED
jgi:DNA-binding response OmpR family regulator